MLTLYEGGFTSLAHDEILKKITASVNSGKRAFLFVPEQQTLTAETEMCDRLPPRAALSFEVTNFTRFTNTAFRALGGISGEYITSAKKALVMWGVLTELSPLLAITRGSKNIGAGTVTKALGAINELSAFGIRPDELRESEKMLEGEDARLKSKLRDLSLIYSLYKDKLSEKYSDLTEDLIGLAEKLDKNPDYLEGVEIILEGFTSFTEPQYALIRAMARCTDITVSLAIKKAARSGFEYTELIETEKRLVKIARDEKVDISLIKPDARHPKYDPTLSEVCELLWRNEGTLDRDSTDALRDKPETVRIFEAATPFEECDFIASDIKRRVMAGGRYSDFAVIARGLDAYRGILDTSLAKAGVPHFMASPKSINSFEAIKLISTAYAAIVRRFATAEVITYAKCGLIGVSREECDLFEIYVSKWNIGGQRFTDGMLWNMNPRGYEALSEGDAERLVRINEIKEKIISPLYGFSVRVKEAKTVREHADALVDFLIDIDLEGKLEERARELLEVGEKDAAEQNGRLWRIICDSLDTVVDAVGDLPADAESFYNQLSVVFSDTNMGSIPSYRDEVSVGQADMARFTDKKHVYLIGVNAGEFPRTVSDTSYFTDRDKQALQRLGLGVAPDLDVKNARELYSFSRSFSFAERTVTLSYSVKTAALSASLPSEVIARIGEITDKAVTPIVIADLPIMDRIYSPEQALENLGRATESEKAAIKNALVGTEYDDIIAVSEGKLENEEVNIDGDAIAIIIGKDVYLSQTKIDRYLTCPFKYFGQAFLGLDENEKAEINQLVVGNFIHSVLENVFKASISEGKSVADLSREERETLTSGAAREYIERELGGVGSAKNEVIIDRIRRVAKPIVEGLCDEFANCRFTPAECELHIDRYHKDTPDSIVYKTSNGAHRIIIGGYIDRVDTLKVGEDVYVRVVDYKTGMKSFSLDDVKEGVNLQMLLYLKAIVETTHPEFREKLGVGDGGQLLPGGIVYVKTSVADVDIDSPSDELALKEVKKSYERLGASLDAPESLAAMNPDFTPMAKSSKRNEEPKPLTYSMDDWAEINRDMEAAVVAIADEITSGHIVAKTNVKPGATFHPCKECPYKFICRSAVT